MDKNRQFHAYKYKHFGTQLRRKEEDKNFKPNRDHIRIQITKYSNNQIHYSQPQKGAEIQTKPKYQPFTKWDAQIKQQPEWMQNLIKHVDFNRLTEVITAVDESDHMIIVSDVQDDIWLDHEHTKRRSYCQVCRTFIRKRKLPPS